jgi:pimeloyl-ACP methyl ester carboxylesterase
MTEAIQIRVEGEDRLPTLIYLPGIHGDWTLITNLRQSLRGRVRFVYFTYPRTLEWSLDDYAAAVEAALAAQNIRAGWLLAESLGSQVAWAMVGRGKLALAGLILAGGFVRHPLPWIVEPAGSLCRRSCLRLFAPFYLAYAKIFRWKNRSNPELLENIREFMARRTELDLRAIRHRLRLIAGNDPRPIARAAKLPVYGLTGLVDPIVPWPFVRGWLRWHCPRLKDYQIIACADHNVLNMGAQPAAKKILEWMNA